MVKVPFLSRENVSDSDEDEDEVEDNEKRRDAIVYIFGSERNLGGNSTHAEVLKAQGHKP